MGHITEEFIKHREWLVKIVWEAHVLPAMMLMTEQLSAVALQQVQIIGTLLDAKHQLETQRLIQLMHAEAHKDYQPSEGVCEFGTNTRSLAASNRNAEFGAVVVATRGLDRQLLSGHNLSSDSISSDSGSRLDQFKRVYCNPKDNGNGMDLLCGGGGIPERYNKDVDYVTTIDLPTTLETDFTVAAATPDEEDIFALSANLYGHKPPPQLVERYLSEGSKHKTDGTNSLMDFRSLAAKRSVAMNSYAVISAMKSQGEEAVQPFMEAILKEMGYPDEEIEDMLGERPSYYAQMDLLTKKLYQDPRFYSDLYDKPANVDRKDVSMRAIELMQKRDIYRSVLRSESIMSIWLEMALIDEQNKVKNEVDRLTQDGRVTEIE